MTRTVRKSEELVWNRVMSGVQEGRFVEDLRWARTERLGVLWLFRDKENGRWRIRAEEETMAVVNARVTKFGVVMDGIGPVTFGWTMAEAMGNAGRWVNEGIFPGRW